MKLIKGVFFLSCGCLLARLWSYQNTCETGDEKKWHLTFIQHFLRQFTSKKKINNNKKFHFTLNQIWCTYVGAEWKLRQQKPSTEWTRLSCRSHIAWRAVLAFKALTPVASDCRDNKKAACQSNGWAVKSTWITQKGRTRIMTYFHVLPQGWAGLRNVWLSAKCLLPRPPERRAHLMWQLSSENPNSMIKNRCCICGFHCWRRQQRSSWWQ